MPASGPNPQLDIREAARRILRAESDAILRTAERLDERFERAVRLIINSGGTVITSGAGKSGHIARKLAATFSARVRRHFSCTRRRRRTVMSECAGLVMAGS